MLSKFTAILTVYRRCQWLWRQMSENGAGRVARLRVPGKVRTTLYDAASQVRAMIVSLSIRK
jgi:hypothetical protein